MSSSSLSRVQLWCNTVISWVAFTVATAGDLPWVWCPARSESPSPGPDLCWFLVGRTFANGAHVFAFATRFGRCFTWLKKGIEVHKAAVMFLTLLFACWVHSKKCLKTNKKKKVCLDFDDSPVATEKLCIKFRVSTTGCTATLKPNQVHNCNNGHAETEKGP